MGKEQKTVENNKGKHPYEDIINLERPVSSNRDHMSIHDRSAQFSPFAALTGFDGAIKETARLTNTRMVLDEEAKIRLDEKLRIIREQVNSQKEIEIVFFQADEYKSGGTYQTERGKVRKIKNYEGVISMESGIRIPIEEIIDMSGEIFQGMDDFFAL